VRRIGPPPPVGPGFDPQPSWILKMPLINIPLARRSSASLTIADLSISGSGEETHKCLRRWCVRAVEGSMRSGCRFQLIIETANLREFTPPIHQGPRRHRDHVRP
jgi:hypothetical protein